MHKTKCGEKMNQQFFQTERADTDEDRNITILLYNYKIHTILNSQLNVTLL